MTLSNLMNDPKLIESAAEISAVFVEADPSLLSKIRRDLDVVIAAGATKEAFTQFYGNCVSNVERSVMCRVIGALDRIMSTNEDEDEEAVAPYRGPMIHVCRDLPPPKPPERPQSEREAIAFVRSHIARRNALAAALSL